MGGYAISVNRFLSLTLSHHSPSVTSTLRSHSFPSIMPLVPHLLPLFPTWPGRFPLLRPLSGWSPETANIFQLSETRIGVVSRRPICYKRL